MGEQEETKKKQRSKKRADLKTMCPQQKARYLAYTKTSKDVQAWVVAARRRICTHMAQEREKVRGSNKVPDSKSPHDTVIGQLKAAEARDRIQQRRLQYENFQAKEMNLIILCQPSALRAMRLEELLAKDKRKNNDDSLDPLQMRRVEEILEDEKGLTIIRG